MTDERNSPKGFVSWLGTAGLVAVAVLVVGVIFGWFLASCDHPAPVQMTPVGQVAPATSSIRVTGTQGVKVTLRHPSISSPHASDSSAPRGDVSSDNWEVVSIEATQSVLGDASLSVGTTRIVQPDHGRLGVIVGPFPGVVAADIELVRVDVPPWWVGVPLELGVDVEANHRQAGAGLSIGNKGFVEVGAFSEWNLSNQGWYAGAGMRF